MDGAEDTLVISLRSSKTDQEGEGDMRLLKDQCTDAVRELRNDREFLGKAHPYDQVIGLSDRAINRRLQAACNAAGLMGRLTSHSGRIGLASELTQRGAEIGAVALAGGWRSPAMVIHYSKRARVEQGAVARYL